MRRARLRRLQRARRHRAAAARGRIQCASARSAQRGRAAQQRDILVVGAARDQRLAEVARRRRVPGRGGTLVVALGSVGVVVEAQSTASTYRAPTLVGKLHRARAQLPRLGVLLAASARAAPKEGLDKETLRFDVFCAAFEVLPMKLAECAAGVGGFSAACPPVGANAVVP